MPLVYRPISQAWTAAEHELTDCVAHLAELKVEVPFSDPWYLMQSPGTDGASLYDVGPQLLHFARTFLAAGMTPVYVHHTNSGLQPGRLPELEDLSHAGHKQAAQQYILLSRKSAYVSGGKHDLWMRAGGRTGHGGVWHLDIDEGVTSAATNTPRHWDVTVQTQAQSIGLTKDKRNADREAAAVTRQADDDRLVRDAVAALITQAIQPTANQLVTHLYGTLSRDRVKASAHRMAYRGDIAKTREPSSNDGKGKAVDVYRPVEPTATHPP